MTAKTCAIDGCPKAACARGWCRYHYDGWRRTGDPLNVQPPAKPIADVIEDVEFMLATGESVELIAARERTTVVALDLRLRRAGRDDLAAPFIAHVQRHKKRRKQAREVGAA